MKARIFETTQKKPVTCYTQFEAWTMEECDYGLSLSQLVTVVVQGHSQGQVDIFGVYSLCVQVTRMVKSLHEAYPGVAAIVETDLNLSQVTFELSKILRKT